ncbi:MAG TPA: regulatory protein GemA [Usitatibacteraceae bacterium]
MSSLAVDHRRRELAQIHIAKKELGMDDDAYRQVISALTNGVHSSAGDLDWQGRKRLLDHLSACGYKQAAARRSKPAAQRFPDKPVWRKAWALWQQLADAKKVEDRRSTAFVAFVCHQANVDAVRWVTPVKLNAVIEALKSWQRR